MRGQKSAKIAILVASGIVFATLLLEAYRENLGMAWRGYQEVYKGEMLASAKDEDDAGLAKRYGIKLRQVVLPELNRVDRCISCHVGIEDPRMADKPDPLKAHPGRILEIHEIEKFGCTVCHDGQGRGVTVFHAHGQDVFWPYPLIDTSARVVADPESEPKVSSPELLQASCYQCHNSPDPFTPPEIGADVLTLGSRLFTEKGCLSCHRVYGIGVNPGIDLSAVGDKPLSEYDFSHFPENQEKTIFNWHYQHVKNPKTVVPSTNMPYRAFSKKELRGLVVFILSLKKRGDNPLLKFSRGKLAGAKVFGAFCAGCHGKVGQGKKMATSLNNRMLLQSVSEQFWRKSIVNGRSGTRVMPAFTFENTGLFPEEVDALIEFIGKWREEHDITDQKNLDLDKSRIVGDAENGKAIFHRNESCSECHGDNGTGTETGAQLNNQDFLKLATDSYIRATILSYRMKIPDMPTDDEINDVVAYMRSWQRHN